MENLSFMGVNINPGIMAVGSNNRKGRNPDDFQEVGLAHSRGVAGIITCAAESHSKGLTLICNGKEKHGKATE